MHFAHFLLHSVIFPVEGKHLLTFKLEKNSFCYFLYIFVNYKDEKLCRSKLCVSVLAGAQLSTREVWNTKCSLFITDQEKVLCQTLTFDDLGSLGGVLIKGQEFYRIPARIVLMTSSGLPWGYGLLLIFRWKCFYFLFIKVMFYGF